MNVKHPLMSGVLIPAIAAVVSTPLFVYGAESPIVVESRESSVTYQPPIEVTDDRGEPSGIESQYQMQLLQQEVMQLRGQVEQLQHQLNRQKSIQDDRYLELDARLQQLMQSQTSPAVTETPTPNDEDSTIISEQPDDSVSEAELYETAQLLIRNRQYDLAITQLDSLIARYPDGEYTANAYYWLGQVYAAKADPDFEKARQALAQVITFFPDHSKVPDAAYALGKAYYALGDCERAVDLLQQVVDQYPGKSAAKLAETYLRDSVDCAI